MADVSKGRNVGQLPRTAGRCSATAITAIPGELTLSSYILSTHGRVCLLVVIAQKCQELLSRDVDGIGRAAETMYRKLVDVQA